MFTAKSRYDKKANAQEKSYEFLSLKECKKLPQNGHALVLGQDGRVARVKVTSVKTWKTRPDVLVGWQFGLYEYGKELVTCNEDNRFFVTEVTE